MTAPFVKFEGGLGCFMFTILMVIVFFAGYGVGVLVWGP